MQGSSTTAVAEAAARVVVLLERNEAEDMAVELENARSDAGGLGPVLRELQAALERVLAEPEAPMA